MILSHLDKNSLHHAYLIEGAREEVLPELFSFFQSLDIKISGNPDFCHIVLDSFKIEEAFDLRSMSSSKSFSGSKKIFVLCANTLTLDAQNVLLKIFEEPAEDTHFFLITPDRNILLQTLVSRFYTISSRKPKEQDKEPAREFIKMPLAKRIDFIKTLLEEEEGEEEEALSQDSARARALKFLNTLESTVHADFISRFSDNPGVISKDLVKCTEHIFRVREFIRMPGSSIKTLMESVALVIPDKI